MIIALKMNPFDTSISKMSLLDFYFYSEHILDIMNKYLQSPKNLNNATPTVSSIGNIPEFI